ncbi:LacI family DNA-binding transcriptional regulator [Sphingomonas sp. DT-204]|uniref:LacI family DNA-binding transcriptional regulator n=1 Tax=Sphingomonas sp. DT-204 TaxID=3396166 RepID=UPI003F197DA4
MTIITIKDVAARAGVSAKTVSRVINGEPHVRAEVREAVMKIVEELDYRPNAFARGLSSSRSFLLGLFIEEVASGYAADIQRGAVERCRALGYHLVIETVEAGQQDWLKELPAILHTLRLQGVILAPPLCDWPELLDMLEAHAVPIVRIAPRETPERTPLVRMNDRAAARELAERLIALGHRDIAFIKGNPTHSAATERWLGFSDVVAAAGLAVRPEWIVDGDFTFRSGVEAAERILAVECPTAVFASNDEMALGVLVSAMRHRIEVPEALSVVGFDDTPIARMAWPQLTTIRQPNPEMAAAAVDLLVGPPSGRPSAETASVELPYSLVLRDSLSPPAR